MGSQPSPAPKIAFGPFEYDSSCGELRKYGNQIRLKGQPLQILSILLEQPSRVVSRDELQRQLWQGTTFVDFEQGLNAAVNKMRQALGDSANQPRYVETLTGRGYRFIAPVHIPGAKPVLEIALPAPIKAEAEPRQEARRWLPWAAVVALAIVGAGSYWLGTHRARTDAPQKPARFLITPPLGFEIEAASNRQSFALSPDGRRLAFTAMDTSGAFRVFVQDLGSLEPRIIAGSEGAHTLFWPPDGRSLFLTARGKVLRASLEGDAHLVVCDAPAFMSSGAWFGPDKLLLCGRPATYAVSPSGGTPEPAKDVCCWPQMLPGGQVLYTGWDSHIGRYRARVARFNDLRSAKDLIESDSRVLYTASVSPGGGYLVYMSAGNLVARPFDIHSLQVVGEASPIVSKIYSFFPSGAADFSVGDKGVIAYQSYVGRSQLAWVNREGRQVRTIGPAKINVKSGRLSPDGRWLATAIYDVDRACQDLWLLDMQTGAARRLGIGPGASDAPVWSPDSKKLAFLRAFEGKAPQDRTSRHRREG